MSKSLAVRLLAECIGTAVLVCCVGCATGKGFYVVTNSGTVDSFYAPWTISFGLLIGMVITGFVSGAMFNPTITVALILKNYFDGKLTKEVLVELLLYFPAQIIGGFFGALFSWIITGKTNYIDIGSQTGDLTAFVLEVAFSYLLALNAERAGKVSDDKIIQGASVALFILLAVASVGELSGACLNPAICLAINGVASHNHSQARDPLLVYVFGPLTGGILAGLSYPIYKDDRVIAYEEDKNIPMETYSE
jgi:glycerol uptake facilitator-like aquaporin